MGFTLLDLRQARRSPDGIPRAPNRWFHPPGNGNARQSSRPDAPKTKARSFPRPFAAFSRRPSTRAKKNRTALPDAPAAASPAAFSPQTKTSANDAVPHTRARSQCPSNANPTPQPPSPVLHPLHGARKHMAIPPRPRAASRRMGSIAPGSAHAPAPATTPHPGC